MPPPACPLEDLQKLMYKSYLSYDLWALHIFRFGVRIWVSVIKKKQHCATA